MNKTTLMTQLKHWWQTDCPFCKKARLLLVWLLLMGVVDYFWFHLLFK